MAEEINDNAKTILDAGAALGAPRQAVTGEDDFVVVPKGYELQDLERFHDVPRRKRGIVKLSEASSFIAYFQRHANIASAIYCDRVKAEFVGVLDDHSAERPDWGGHRVVLNLKHTPNWATWKQFDKHQIDQVKFAEFLEQNSIDVVEPAGAELLEMALHLEQHRTVEFKSVQRLKDGQRQFSYDETLKGTTQSGQVSIPERFKLRMAVYEGGDALDHYARLRYRVKEGTATFWYEIERLEEAERVALDAAAEEVETETKRAVWFGTPRS